jgi:hypothetical protein
MDTDNKEYETHDIYLASYLKISGCQLIRRRRQGQRVHFVFINPGGSISTMREAYYSGQGMVAAVAFSNELKAMKEMCFDPE